MSKKCPKVFKTSFRRVVWVVGKLFQLLINATECYVSVMCRELQSFTVLTTLSNPNLWIKPISWTRVLSRSRSSPNHLLSYWEIIQSIRHGTPTETESDQCIIKILRSSLKEGCKIPATCVATLMKKDDTTGYPLTHRLLIVQVAKAVSKMLENSC